MGIISSKYKSHAEDEFVIIMYHRIIPQEEVKKLIQPGMYVTPSTFILHMKIYKELYDIVALSDIPIKKSKKNRPRVIITFDDGWYDFYRYAYPILCEHQIPATIPIHQACL